MSTNPPAPSHHDSVQGLTGTPGTQAAGSGEGPGKEELANVSIDAPLIASHNSYLSDQSSEIRVRNIPWEGYQKASLITEVELNLIRSFTLDCKNGQEYANLFLSLLQKLSRVDTIQSILVLIDDFCDAGASLYFSQQQNSSACFAVFFKLLSKDDEYIQLKSAKIVTRLLIDSKLSYPTDPNDLFTWIRLQLMSINGSVIDITLQILQGLLSIYTFRQKFYLFPDGITSILSILRKDQSNAQIQYQCIYSIWLLSFVREAAADLGSVYHITPLFKDIAKAAIKEKVVRVTMATFKNMVVNAPQETIIPMLGHKLLQDVEVLSVRKWSDQEITDDLMFLRDELGKHVASLSTFDEYASEIRSGRLEWSPPHQSEQFWKANANRLNENKNELVKALVQIAADSGANSKIDPVCLAVAAHDLGQYCKFGANAKKVLDETGGKAVVMELMSHENADVRYQALTATQKIMMNSW